MSLDWASQMLTTSAQSSIQHMVSRFLDLISGVASHRVSFPIVGLISSCSFACQRLSFSFLFC